MWTLEAAGFEPSRLAASGAALLNQELGSDYPRMRWMSNYDRLACATMWTLFFAGDLFAPGIGPVGFEAEGGQRSSMQEFLQGHYFASMAKIAGRLARFPHVVGFDSLNEPSAGFIGKGGLDQRGGANSFGTTPTPWEAILAGSGRPQSVAILDIKFFSRGESGFELATRGSVGSETIGTEGVRAWKDGVDCVWRRAGVWSEEGGVPVIERNDHFALARGERVDFTRDCLEPFIKRFGREVGAAGGDASGRFVPLRRGRAQRRSPHGGRRRRHPDRRRDALVRRPHPRHEEIPGLPGRRRAQQLDRYRPAPRPPLFLGRHP